MNLGAIYKQAKKAVADNAPAILTAIGVTGTITTAVLASRATFKAGQVMTVRHHELVDDKFDPLPMVDQVKKVFPDIWKYYVPAVGTGAITVACTIGANHLSTRRAAVLASAYSVSQEFFKEYKDKVIEKLGESGEQEVRDEVAQDRVDKNPPRSEIIIVGDNVLCCDLRTGRYFQSNMEDIRKAENDINWQVLNQFCASLTDFYDKIGLDGTDESDELGWNSDMNQLSIEFSPVFDHKKRPCLGISFNAKPIRGYHSAY